MKTFTKEEIEKLNQKYDVRWVEAMIAKQDEILDFIERNESVYHFDIPQVFFSPNGFSVFEKDGERRIFCNPNALFDLQPLDAAFAEGDWREWLKGSTKTLEIK